MNSRVLKPCRWVARGAARSGTTWIGSGARWIGREAFLFFAIMPLGAPLLALVRATVLALRAAGRAVLRDETTVLRRMPAAAFRPVPFFGRRRAFPATAHAWMFTLLYGGSSKVVPKKYAPHRERLGLHVWQPYISHLPRKSMLCGTAKPIFNRQTAKSRISVNTEGHCPHGPDQS